MKYVLYNVHLQLKQIIETGRIYLVFYILASFFFLYFGYIFIYLYCIFIVPKLIFIYIYVYYIYLLFRVNTILI